MSTPAPVPMTDKERVIDAREQAALRLETIIQPPGRGAGRLPSLPKAGALLQMLEKETEAILEMSPNLNAAQATAQIEAIHKRTTTALEKYTPPELSAAAKTALSDAWKDLHDQTLAAVEVLCTQDEENKKLAHQRWLELTGELVKGDLMLGIPGSDSANLLQQRMDEYAASMEEGKEFSEKQKGSLFTWDPKQKVLTLNKSWWHSASASGNALAIAVSKLIEEDPSLKDGMYVKGGSTKQRIAFARELLRESKVIHLTIHGDKQDNKVRAAELARIQKIFDVKKALFDENNPTRRLFSAGEDTEITHADIFLELDRRGRDSNDKMSPEEALSLQRQLMQCMNLENQDAITAFKEEILEKHPGPIAMAGNTDVLELMGVVDNFITFDTNSTQQPTIDAAMLKRMAPDEQRRLLAARSPDQQVVLFSDLDEATQLVVMQPGQPNSLDMITAKHLLPHYAGIREGVEHVIDNLSLDDIAAVTAQMDKLPLTNPQIERAIKAQQRMLRIDAQRIKLLSNPSLMDASSHFDAIRGAWLEANLNTKQAIVEQVIAGGATTCADLYDSLNNLDDRHTLCENVIATSSDPEVYRAVFMGILEQPSREVAIDFIKEKVDSGEFDMGMAAIVYPYLGTDEQIGMINQHFSTAGSLSMLIATFSQPILNGVNESDVLRNIMAHPEFQASSSDNVLYQLLQADSSQLGIVITHATDAQLPVLLTSPALSRDQADQLLVTRRDIIVQLPAHKLLEVFRACEGDDTKQREYIDAVTSDASKTALLVANINADKLVRGFLAGHPNAAQYIEEGLADLLDALADSSTDIATLATDYMRQTEVLSAKTLMIFCQTGDPAVIAAVATRIPPEKAYEVVACSANVPQLSIGIKQMIEQLNTNRQKFIVEKAIENYGKSGDTSVLEQIPSDILDQVINTIAPEADGEMAMITGTVTVPETISTMIERAVSDFVIHGDYLTIKESVLDHVSTPYTQTFFSNLPAEDTTTIIHNAVATRTRDVYPDLLDALTTHMPEDRIVAAFQVADNANNNEVQSAMLEVFTHENIQAEFTNIQTGGAVPTA